MLDKLDHFTNSAQGVLTLAQEEALRLNHNYVGTEHLLLGLVREENGIIVKVLRELGVDPGAVIRAVERIIGRGELAPFGKPTMAPRAKRATELAIDEARLMGHDHIGSEHILLGLVREGEGIAVNVLRGLGINLDRIRNLTVEKILQDQSQSNKGPSLIGEFEIVKTTIPTKVLPPVFSTIIRSPTQRTGYRELTIPDIFRVLPIDDSLRSEIINDWDSYDEGRQFGHTVTAWNAFGDLEDSLIEIWHKSFQLEYEQGLRKPIIRKYVPPLYASRDELGCYIDLDLKDQAEEHFWEYLWMFLDGYISRDEFLHGRRNESPEIRIVKEQMYNLILDLLREQYKLQQHQIGD